MTKKSSQAFTNEQFLAHTAELMLVMDVGDRNKTVDGRFMETFTLMVARLF